jgi:hypothetical protein
MSKNIDYQQKHLDAIYSYYHTLCIKEKQKISLRESVISWLTDGHAEKFREEYLKNHSVLV